MEKPPIDITDMKKLTSTFISQELPLNDFNFTMKKLYIEGLKKQGKTNPQIAKILHCSTATISKILTDERSDEMISKATSICYYCNAVLKTEKDIAGWYKRTHPICGPCIMKVEYGLWEDL